VDIPASTTVKPLDTPPPLRYAYKTIQQLVLRWVCIAQPANMKGADEDGATLT
jgi:hypothetical protein